MALGLALCHTAAAAAQASNAAPTQAGAFRIAGTVVNAVDGSALPRARVAIQDARNPQNLYWTITSEDGRFEFNYLTSGKYAMRGEKRGFIAADYDQHEQFSTAIVTGAGVDTEHLVLRLLPVAVLSGKMLDERGEPVRQASVSLYAEDRGMGVGRIRKVGSELTDDQGSYEFAPLDAGTYFISVTAIPWYTLHPLSNGQQEMRNTPPATDQPFDVAYPVAYYKDATEPDEASPIPIRGGDHLEADIHLSPVPALHLLFHVPDNGEQGVTLPMLQKPSFDGTEDVPVTGSSMVSPGLFEITGIAAGRYTIRMRHPGPPQTSEFEMDLTSNGQELDAAKGGPVSTVKAVVKVLGEAKLPPRLTVFLRNTKLRVIAQQAVDEKGEVEFQGISVGKYEVLAQAPGKAYSVLRISSSGREMSGHTLNVPAGASLAIKLTLVGSAMKVEGYAKRAGQATPGVMVVLVPKNPESNRELFRRDQSDLDGSFSLRGVIPGSYTICAIEDGWQLDWTKPAVITHYCQHGQRLVVPDQPEGTLTLQEAVAVELK